MFGGEDAIKYRHNDSFTAGAAERIGNLQYFRAAPPESEEIVDSENCLGKEVRGTPAGQEVWKRAARLDQAMFQGKVGRLVTRADMQLTVDGA